MTDNIRTFPDTGAMNRAAFDLIAELAREAVAKRAVFTLALSGGSTPAGLFSLFAEESNRRLIPWLMTHVFWADERCVPPTHPDSNYKMAYDLFLGALGLPERAIHRIKGEDDPEKAAEDYSREMETLFSERSINNGSVPVFDCILLGLGGDGHTASLFPGSPALTETKSPAVANDAGPGIEPRNRITMTYPVLNAARNVIFLVSGESKREVLRAVTGENKGKSGFPAAGVEPAGGLYWLYDQSL